jgi:hypothetical protein
LFSVAKTDFSDKLDHPAPALTQINDAPDWGKRDALVARGFFGWPKFD